MNSDCFIILSSGVALGVYIPPLIINKQLRTKGINTEFYVIETLIQEEKIDNILKNKFVFHRNFKIALIGQKLSEKSDYGLDKGKIQQLYYLWDEKLIKRFLVFSGFWVPLVENYLATRNHIDYAVDFCHLDSSISTSWKNHGLSKINYRDIWFFNICNSKINYYIEISDKRPIEFNDRDKRFVIHGGGWGMGTYKEKIQELKNHKIKLDIINYEISDINENNSEDIRNFLIDPKWKTWEKCNLEYIFPPFCQITDNKYNKFDCSNKYPAIYDLIRNSIGIISKPGGATLIDSFSSATPIIFLEPFGDYERRNAILWKKLGFGIDYFQWILMDCSTDILWQMHKNLTRMLAKTQNIIDLYV